ncbi:MAG: DNA polymerase III subunit beta [Pseudomonadota bacterium]
METRIDRDELLRCVSRVQSIIEKRTNMPILSTVLLNASGSELTISATDLELGLRQVMSGEVIQEGSMTISGRKLFEILKESRGPTFHIKEKENNWVFITDYVARFDLACQAADEFPAFIEPEGVKMVAIDGETLSDMINKTIYAVTMEETGFKLSGILTEKVMKDGALLFRMVSTDGHRLSLVDKPLPNLESLQLTKGVMVPKKGMTELNKLAGEGGVVEIGFEQKNCVARKEGAVMVVRLLETKFPDYHAVIPTGEKFKISVDRVLFMEAMRKMLILSNERYRAVKIAIENDNMELVSTNPDLGEAQESIKVEYKGERMEMGFNPRYFVDTLQSMASETIVLSFVDSLKPCMLRGEADGGFLGLIMPMRV